MTIDLMPIVESKLTMTWKKHLVVEYSEKQKITSYAVFTEGRYDGASREPVQLYELLVGEDFLPVSNIDIAGKLKLSIVQETGIEACIHHTKVMEVGKC